MISVANQYCTRPFRYQFCFMNGMKNTGILVDNLRCVIYCGTKTRIIQIRKSLAVTMILFRFAPSCLELLYSSLEFLQSRKQFEASYFSIICSKFCVRQQALAPFISFMLSGDGIFVEQARQGSSKQINLCRSSSAYSLEPLQMLKGGEL
jgi:hypothetical protein